MNKFKLGISLVVISLLAMSSWLVRADFQVSNFPSCVETVEDGRIVWMGYFSYEALSIDSSALIEGGASIVGDLPSHFHEGQYDHVFGFRLPSENANASWTIARDGWTQTTYAFWDAGTSPCSNGTGEPDGGFESVSFNVAPGCYTWQFFDNVWQDVVLDDGELAITHSQEEDGRVFIRLTLVKGSVTDTSLYRVWMVDCPS